MQNPDGFTGLYDVLKEVSKDFCKTTITLEKTVLDRSGQPDPTKALSGWEFNFSVPSNSPLLFHNESGTNTISKKVTTNDNGLASATMLSQNPDVSTNVTIVETPKEGYTLKALTCINSADGTSVPVDSQGDAYGITVPSYAEIHCSAENQPEEQFEVVKTALSDQMPDIPGNQSTAVVGQDGRVVAHYEIKITNLNDSPGGLAGELVDQVTPPENFSLVKMDFWLGDQEIKHDGGVIQGSELGEFDANESKALTVAVELEAIDHSRLDLLDEPGDECSPVSTVRNTVSFEETSSEDCVPLKRSSLLFEKIAIDANDDGQISTDDVPFTEGGDGRFVEYQIKVSNPQDSAPRTYSVTDRLNFPEGVVVKNVNVLSEQTGDTADAGPVNTVNITDLLFGEGNEQTILPNEAHTYRVQVEIAPVTAERFESLEDQCLVDYGGLRNSATLTSGTLEIYDEDCFPVPPPQPFNFIIRKVDANDNTALLEGAEFTVMDQNGQVLKILEEVEPGVHQGSLEVGPEYRVRETRSPKGFVLGASEIRIRALNTEAGLILAILNKEDVVGVSVTEPDFNVENAGLIVENVGSGELPQTGGDGVHHHLLLGALLIGLGAYRARK